ncbi:MAG: hypothetical protein HY720_16680, partial [Planctomycetes bacterium]|nr:hypothetical protein [Planctomycetota bacterium]
MKAWIRTSLLVAVLLAPALPAAGQESIALVLVDGTMVKGRLEGLSATEVSILPQGEAAPLVLPYDRIEPIHVYYLLRDRLAQATGTDPARARLAIADYCLAHDLFYFGGVEYERAIELDPSLESEAREGLDTAEEGQADALYRRAIETYSRGDVPGAKAILRKAAERFPNSGTVVLINDELARLDDAARRAAERKAARERK